MTITILSACTPELNNPEKLARLTASPTPSPSPSATAEAETETETTTTVETTTTTSTIGPTAPTLSSISTLSGASEDTAFTITYAALAAAANEADENGDALSFRIEAVSTGTLTKNAAPVTAGSTTLASGEELVWTPASNANGTLNAFTVKAYDGQELSSSAVQVQVSVAAVNDAPTISAVADQSPVAPGASIGPITFAFGEGGGADEDGQTATATITSSNTLLVPNASITLTGGTDSGDADALTPTITIAPASGKIGHSTITVSVSDGTNTTIETFEVRVMPQISNLKLWLKADSGVYADAGSTAATNNGAVQQWNDISGSTYHLSQTTAAAQPVWISNGGAAFNNKPLVRFDGSSDYLNQTTADIVSSGGERTIVVVGKADNSSGGSALLAFRRSAKLFVANLGLSGPDFYIYTDGVNATNNMTIANSVTLIRSPFVAAYTSLGAGTLMDVSLNGGNMTVSTTGAGGAIDSETGTTGFSLGRREDTGVFWHGDIAEVLIFNTALSISDRQKIEAYLGVKYGITTIPTSNQKLWLKADAGVYSDAGSTAAANNDTVQQWSDQSGSGHNATQSTSGNRPTYLASGINGKPAIRFNATSSYLDLGNSGTHSDTYNIFAAFSPNDALNQRAYFSNRSANMPTGGSVLYLGQSGGNLFSYQNSSSPPGLSTTTNPLSNGTPVISSFRVGHLTRHFLLNGAESVQYSSTQLRGRCHLTRGHIGWDQANGEYLHGDLAELISIGSDLPSSDVQRTNLYLAEKYGITPSTLAPLDVPGLTLWLRADAGVTPNSTNLLQYSEQLNQSSVWSASGVTVSSNAAQDPNAAFTTSERLVAAGASGNPDAVTLYQNAYVPTGTASKSLTFSVWIKSNTGGNQTFRLENTHSGVLANVTGTQTATTSWNRFTYTVTNGASEGDSAQRIAIKDDAADDGFDLIVYGAQLEEGAAATDYVTTTTDYTNLVATWVDQSGNGYNATQTTLAKQPARIHDGGAGFNNKPVVRCDGNDILITPRLTSQFTSGFSSFIVFNATDGQPATSQTPFGAIDTSPVDTYFYLYIFPAGGFQRSVIQNNNFVSVTLDTFADGAVPTQLVSSVADPNGSLESWVSGVSKGTATLTGLNWASLTKADTETLGICSRTVDGVASAGGLTGDIAEVLIYSTALTTAQRQSIECYLARKYNHTATITALSCP